MASNGPPPWPPPNIPMPNPFQIYAVLKPLADQALINQNFGEAFNRYTGLIEMSLPFTVQMKAELFSKRSITFSKMENNEQAALQDAITCFNLCPKWKEGYWLASKAWKKIANVLESLRMLVIGVEQCTKLEDKMIEFWIEIVETLCVYQDTTLPFNIPVPDIETRLSLFHSLIERRSWEAISLLVTGCHRGCNTDIDCIASNCNMEAISITHMLKSMDISTLKRYGIKLAVACLKHKASYSDPANEFGLPIIHVALKISLDTDNVDLFRELLTNNLTEQEKNSKDENGDSAYHVLVKSGKIHTTCGETILNIMLNFGCDPLLRDAADKKAIQFVEKTSIAYRILDKAEKSLELPKNLRSIQSLKEKAKLELDRNKFETSYELYSDALEIAKKVNTEEIPKLLCNRCLVLCKMEKYTEALEDAELSIKADPNWTKGYWRAAKALKGQYKTLDAINKLLTGVTKCKAKDDRVEFWAEIAYILSIRVSGDKRINIGSVPDHDIHPLILERLQKSDRWQAISLLVTGIHSGTKSEIDGKAVNCEMKSLSVGCLIKSIDSMAMKKWGARLAVDMLKKGSSRKTIEEKTGRPIVHVCLKIALTTDNVDLFRELLTNYLTEQEKNAKDENGDSSYHVLVRSGKIHTTCGETILKIMLNSGCDPLLRDASNKKVIQFVEETSIAYRMLDKAEKSLELPKKFPAQNIMMKETRCKVETEKTSSQCKQCMIDLERIKELIQNDIDSACKLVLTVTRRRHTQAEIHFKIVNTLIDLLVDNIGVPALNSTGKTSTDTLDKCIPCALLKLNFTLFKKFINGLIEKKKWLIVYAAAKAHAKRVSNIVRKIPLKEALHDLISMGVKDQRIDLILESFIDGGAKVDEKLLYQAVEREYFRTIPLMLKKGLMLREGETPMHAAINIGLQDRNFKLFDGLLEIYLSNKRNYPELDPKKRDSRGDSLLHIICKAKYSNMQFALDAVKRLKNLNVNDGKIPQFDTGPDIFTIQSDTKKDLIQNIQSRPPNINRHIECATKEKKPQMEKQTVTNSELKQRAQDLISGLDPTEYEISNSGIMLFKRLYEKTKKPNTKEDDHDDHNWDVSDIEGVDEFNIEPSLFGKLAWEVECTEEFWKSLQDRKTPLLLKKKAIIQIQTLAKGQWDSHLCKPLTYPQQMSVRIKLFETKLTKSVRIIWEQARTFSARLSDSQTSSNGNCDTHVDVIRLWAIVTNHDHIHRTVERIVKSYQRGESCKVNQKLVKVQQNKNPAVQEKLPSYYIYADKSKVCKKEYLHFPAANPNEIEYNILKFYHISSSLVSFLLANSETDIDLPFKVTPAERSVICLPNNAPILLVGRSGTGKTTCCLYRLWDLFKKFWDFQLQIGGACSEMQDIITDDETNDDMNTTCGTGDSFMDTLRQLFVSKNPFLCREVNTKFNQLNCKCETTENESLPYKLQDMQELHYPLFTTFKQLLLLLDASLPRPYFFERNENGDLKAEVMGWSYEQEDNLLYLLEEESVLSDDDDNIDIATSKDYEEDSKQQNEIQIQRKEVTYEMFENEIWKKINKGFDKYKPSLVWTEIVSFITGSFEALKSPDGELSKGDYKDIGLKRAPIYTDQRDDIYEIFTRYKMFKRQRFLFDKMDLVYKIFDRLRTNQDFQGHFHQIFVDETQDFSQAELFLLMKLCNHPNDMFLTGDTAQSIMKGISFRFKDLKSLFHYAKEQDRKEKSQIHDLPAIIVPKNVHQLTHNYRSHEGILRLASSIVDLIIAFFPESFDSLERDQGLFDGPNPVLLQSCVISDLPILLRGSQRETSAIEFGAHQVVLVADEAAKGKVPEELKHALILTIYESKGLEFDDVLLFNFFKDSLARKEWRVVTSYLDHGLHSNSDENQTQFLVEINEERENGCTAQNVLSRRVRPRPLDFNPSEHKLLSSELKCLYTAVTRARVNVWIFDEDEDNRAPMFDYLLRRKLADTREINDVLEKSDEFSVKGFAHKSSKQQWDERGYEFLRRRMFQQAETCFEKAENRDMLKVSEAFNCAKKGNATNDINDKRKFHLQASVKFLESNMPDKAVVCLHRAKAPHLEAQLHEKIGKFDKAAEIYRKLKCPSKSKRCYEKCGKFEQAIKILHENEQYEDAVKVLQQYKQKQLVDEDFPYTIESLSFDSAEYCHRTGNSETMMVAIERLDVEVKMEFLLENGYIDLVTNALMDEGNYEEAIRLLNENGKFDEAVDIALKWDESRTLQCRCLYLKAHSLFYSTRDQTCDENENQSKLTDILNQAIKAAKFCKDKDISGKSYLLLGMLQTNELHIRKAFAEFMFAEPYRNEAGQLDCMAWMIKNANLKTKTTCRQLVIGMANLFEVMRIISSKKEPKRLRRILECYGIIIENQQSVSLFPKQMPSATKMIQQKTLKKCEHNKMKTRYRISMNTVCEQLCSYLLKQGKEWFRILTNAVNHLRSANVQCQVFLEGGDCIEPSCEYLHETYKNTTYTNLLEIDALLIQLEKNVRDGSEALSNTLTTELKKKNKELFVLPSSKYLSCQQFLNDFMRKLCHRVMFKNKWFIDSNAKEYVRRYFLSEFRHFQNRKHIRRHISRVVEMMFVSDVFEIDLNWISILHEFERNVQRQFEKQMTNLGFLRITGQKEENAKLYESMARRFQSAYTEVCKYKNPFEALMQFSKFLNFMKSRNNIDLLPKWNHLLFWIEIFISIGLCFISKLTDSEDDFFILPKSYYSAIGFVDATFPKTSTWRAIQKYNPKSYSNTLKAVQDRIQQMLDFLFSMPKTKTSLTNIIFETEKDGYELQERILILCLTCLCNIGRSIQKQNEPYIVRDICNKEISRQCPDRLRNAMEKLQTQCSGLQGIANILSEILNHRNKEYLLLCKFCRSGSPVVSYHNVEDFSLFCDGFVHEETLTVIEDPSTEISELFCVKQNEEQNENNNPDQVEKQENQIYEDDDKTDLTIEHEFEEKEKNQIIAEDPLSKMVNSEKRFNFDHVGISDDRCNICGISFMKEETIEEEKDKVYDNEENDEDRVIIEGTAVNINMSNISESNKNEEQDGNEISPFEKVKIKHREDSTKTVLTNILEETEGTNIKIKNSDILKGPVTDETGKEANNEPNTFEEFPGRMKDEKESIKNKVTFFSEENTINKTKKIDILNWPPESDVNKEKYNNEQRQNDYAKNYMNEEVTQPLSEIEHVASTDIRPHIDKMAEVIDVQIEEESEDFIKYPMTLIKSQVFANSHLKRLNQDKNEENRNNNLDFEEEKEDTAVNTNMSNITESDKNEEHGDNEINPFEKVKIKHREDNTKTVLTNIVEETEGTNIKMKNSDILKGPMTDKTGKEANNEPNTFEEFPGRIKDKKESIKNEVIFFSEENTVNKTKTIGILKRPLESDVKKEKYDNEQRQNDYAKNYMNEEVTQPLSEIEHVASTDIRPHIDEMAEVIDVQIKEESKDFIKYPMTLIKSHVFADNHLKRLNHDKNEKNQDNNLNFAEEKEEGYDIVDSDEEDDEMEETAMNTNMSNISESDKTEEQDDNEINPFEKVKIKHRSIDDNAKALMTNIPEETEEVNIKMKNSDSLKGPMTDKTEKEYDNESNTFKDLPGRMKAKKESMKNGVNFFPQDENTVNKTKKIGILKQPPESDVNKEKYDNEQRQNDYAENYMKEKMTLPLSEIEHVARNDLRRHIDDTAEVIDVQIEEEESEDFTQYPMTLIKRQVFADNHLKRLNHEKSYEHRENKLNFEEETEKRYDNEDNYEDRVVIEEEETTLNTVMCNISESDQNVEQDDNEINAFEKVTIQHRDDNTKAQMTNIPVETEDTNIKMQNRNILKGPMADKTEKEDSEQNTFEELSGTMKDENDSMKNEVTLFPEHENTTNITRKMGILKQPESEVNKEKYDNDQRQKDYAKNYMKEEVTQALSEIEYGATTDIRSHIHEREEVIDVQIEEESEDFTQYPMTLIKSQVFADNHLKCLNHEKSDEHRENSQNFEKFKVEFNSNIGPRFDQICSFIENSDLHSAAKSEVVKIWKHKGDFERKCHDIEDKCDWTKINDLLELITKMASEQALIEKSIKSREEETQPLQRMISIEKGDDLHL